MKVSEDILRQVIREAMGAEKLLDALGIQVIIHGSSKDVKIEKILSDIRVIKGVATISQDSAIKRTPTGRRVIDLTITFDPDPHTASEYGGNTKEYIDKLCRAIKKYVVSVDTVILRTLNDKPLRDDQGRRIVY